MLAATEQRVADFRISPTRHRTRKGKSAPQTSGSITFARQRPRRVDGVMQPMREGRACPVTMLIEKRGVERLVPSDSRNRRTDDRHRRPVSSSLLR